MDSINQAAAGKKLGHVRRQSYGKIMPISSLLSNLIGSNTNFESAVVNDASDGDHSTLAQSFELHGRNSRINERSDGDSSKNVTNMTIDFINHEKHDEQINATPAKLPVTEADVEKTFLKCVNYHAHESESEAEFKKEIVATENAKIDEEDDIDRLMVTGKNVPCLICTNKDAMKNNFLNILCKKLCDGSCNTSTRTCQSHDDGLTHNTPLSNVSTRSDDADDDKDATHRIDIIDGDYDKTKPEPMLQCANSSRQEFLASMLEPDGVANTSNSDDDDNGTSHVAPLTMENLKQFNDRYFREKLAIAEALANTSMMSSPAVKRRLAARKIEMSLNTPDFVYDPENAEYIPPKELLMYLVR